MARSLSYDGGFQLFYLFYLSYDKYLTAHCRFMTFDYLLSFQDFKTACYPII